MHLTTSSACATVSDALATSLPTRLPLFAGKKSRSRCLTLAPQGRGPICYIFMLLQIWAGGTNCGPYSQKDGRVRIINATIKYVLHACNRFRGCMGRRGRTQVICYACVAGSQIQDPALMLGTEGACMGLDKARGTNPSPNPLGDTLGRNMSHRRGKRSRYDVNSLSSRTCDTIFVEC